MDRNTILRLAMADALRAAVVDAPGGTVDLVPTGLERIARLCRITDHLSGAYRRWEPNDEQLRYWSEAAGHRRVYAAKPRQIGLTTAVTLEDVVWTGGADRRGHRVVCPIVVDTEEKTRERMVLAGSLARQVFGDVDATTERVTFANGSEIVGVTAGGNRAGASLTFQRLHLSELPFWRDPTTFATLMPSAIGKTVVIETTIDITAPTGSLARTLWRTPNEWRKIFFRVEDHATYRRDPDELREDGAPVLSQQMEERLRAEGFTDRSSMAWFAHVAENDCAGDLVRAFREYPQVPGHMFQSAEGRVVQVTPRVLAPLRTVDVDAVSGPPWRASIFVEPTDTSRQLLLGVDTAAGKERDRSVVAVVDKRDERLCASFTSDTIWHDDLARVALELQRLYSYRPPDILHQAQPLVVPPALVEDNGVGGPTSQACRRLGVVVSDVTTTKESRYDGIIAAKRSIESGRVYGPAELAEECDDLHRDHLGRFAGRKDLIMAIGFCLVTMRAQPYTPPAPTPDPNVYSAKGRIRPQRGW